MARKVVVYELLSVDGVAEHPDEFITDWDDALDANLAEIIGTQDAVILGRRSFDEWSGHWPSSDMEPFASFINGVEKHVATSSALGREWTNSAVINGDLVAFTRELKGRPGDDIGVHGSLSVAQALLAAGLVDDLRLVMAPAIVGRGRRLLDDLQSVQLETIRIETSATGHLMAHYRVR